MAVILTGMGTLACGLSTRMETLIAARFVCDIAGQFLSWLILVTDRWIRRRRSIYDDIVCG